MIKGKLLGTVDQICLHGIGGRVALVDVHEVSEMPADCGVPNIYQFR